MQPTYGKTTASNARRRQPGSLRRLPHAALDGMGHRPGSRPPHLGFLPSRILRITPSHVAAVRDAKGNRHALPGNYQYNEWHMQCVS